MQINQYTLFVCNAGFVVSLLQRGGWWYVQVEGAYHE